MFKVAFVFGFILSFEHFMGFFFIVTLFGVCELITVVQILGMDLVMGESDPPVRDLRNGVCCGVGGALSCEPVRQSAA